MPLIKSGSLNIRSVHNSHVQELTLTLKIIGQCDVKHILTSQIITIMPVLKISTYIITSIAARPVRLAVILAIMSVTTFKTTVILYYTITDFCRSQYEFLLTCKIMASVNIGFAGQ